MYNFSCTTHVSALPNARGYINIGKAKLTHDMSGFTLEGGYKGEQYKLFWPAEEQYSVHIEYEYLGKYGDCIDLNTVTDTFYIYPEDCDFSVTKFSLATEEMYKF